MIYKRWKEKEGKQLYDMCSRFNDRSQTHPWLAAAMLEHPCTGPSPMDKLVPWLAKADIEVKHFLLAFVTKDVAPNPTTDVHDIVYTPLQRRDHHCARLHNDLQTTQKRLDIYDRRAWPAQLFENLSTVFGSDYWTLLQLGKRQCTPFC